MDLIISSGLIGDNMIAVSVANENFQENLSNQNGNGVIIIKKG
jgi:hypothetical protein